MSMITLKVNGRSHTGDVDSATPLLYVLSDDLALRGPKFGCGLGQCGCCTVIIKGQAVRSCVTPVSTDARAQITKLDGRGSSNQLDGWLAINSDGSVTAYTGKCELGHGLYTAQTQLVAEELSVALNRVKLIQCDTALTPDQGTTSGAQSHPTNFNQGALGLAG